MKKKGIHYASIAGIVLLSAFAAFMVLRYFFPPIKQINMATETFTNQKFKRTVIELTALGDSLTEGVGDSTKQGGYVAPLKRDLVSEYAFKNVATANFGKSGDRSDQILKRIAADKKLQASLKKADLITLTVGGNDLMKVISGDLTGAVNEKKFDAALDVYQSRLVKLFGAIQALNPKAPIYLLGIYNPFYGQLDEAQSFGEYVDRWNKGTRQTADKAEKVYFVPISEKFMATVTDRSASSSATGRDSSSSDAADTSQLPIYIGDDHFHPNSLGYEMIATAFQDEMIKTQEDWLPKEK